MWWCFLALGRPLGENVTLKWKFHARFISIGSAQTQNINVLSLCWSTFKDEIKIKDLLKLKNKNKKKNHSITSCYSMVPQFYSIWLISHSPPPFVISYARNYAINELSHSKKNENSKKSFEKLITHKYLPSELRNWSFLDAYGSYHLLPLDLYVPGNFKGVLHPW